MKKALKTWQEYRKKHFWIDSSYLIIVAAIAGLGTGLIAVIFHNMIFFFKDLLFGGGQKLLTGFMGEFYVVLIPAAGGLLVGIIVNFFAREAKGHGIPKVMEAIANKDGVMKPRIVLTKTLTSSISIGSGGSLGSEGPIVQISAGMGSTIGQLLKLTPELMKTLVACGAAGGISATFNAPIGGVMFAQELILGEFATSNFILIVISSVTSNIISQIYLGNYPAFRVPPYELVAASEMMLYLVLGFLAGLMAVLYIKVLYWFEERFDNLKRVPEYLKPMLGGLLVGVIGIKFPHVFGIGYETIEGVLDNSLPVLLVLSLLFIKLIATSISIGSGGSGGVFAPGLFLGAMLGGSFGWVVHTLFPTATAPAGAYALVGMGGVFAGMCQAPITGIIMLFEMTGNYLVVLPLMVVCVISSLVARGLYPETIYTEKLRRQGLNIDKNQPVNFLSAVKVGDVMSQRVVTLDASMTLSKAKDNMLTYSYSGFPVVKSGYLVGILMYEDVLQEIRQENTAATLEEILTGKLITIYPDDPLRVAVEKMARADVGHIPVVDRQDESKLLGIISRSDIIKAYPVERIGKR